MQAYIYYINKIVHILILSTKINAISHVIVALKTVGIYYKNVVLQKMHKTK